MIQYYNPLHQTLNWYLVLLLLFSTMDSTKENATSVSVVYQQKFQPDYYIFRYYTGQLEAGIEFILQNHHKFFTLAGNTVTSTVSKKKILEIGSGPVPIHVLSASRISDSIVCSDFLEVNRRRLLEWLMPAKDLDSHDKWVPYAQYVAQIESLSCEQCEQNINNTGLEVLERVRRSVKNVIHCDVTQENPLMGNSTVDKLYDIVISVFCIEVAVDSLSEFNSAVKNVVNLLEPSGHLLMVGGLKGSYYYIKDKPIARLKLTREKVESALVGAGCQVQNWFELPRSCRPSELPIDYDAMYYCVAKKI